MGNISDQAWENLSMLEPLVNDIKFRNLNETGQEFKNFFPDFTWVLRDFSLMSNTTPENYIEFILE